MRIVEIHAPPSFDGSEGLLALVITGRPDKPGCHFVTSPEQGIQVASILHPYGTVIKPHLHPPSLRQITRTHEVLIVKRGRLRATFYTSDRHLAATRTLKTGEVVILLSGGHGFEALTEVELIEVKQGPYLGQGDKVLI